MSALAALAAREWRLALRAGGGASGVAFLLALTTLAPFALGPDLNLLSRIGPALLWIGALLAMLLGLDRLFQSDYEDGSLDQMQLSEAPLEAVVLVKCLAHWAANGLPVVLAAPPMGLLLAQDGGAMARLFAALLAGTPALALLGALGAAAAASLRRGGFLIALLTMPLTTPVLIFGVAAAQAGPDSPAPFANLLAICAALSLAAAALCPFAIAALLRRAP